MHIERAARNSTVHKRFWFSFQAPIKAAAAKLRPRPAAIIAHTPLVTCHVQVLRSLYLGGAAGCFAGGQPHVPSVNGVCMSNASLSGRVRPDRLSWERKAYREITDGLLHVHVGGISSLSEPLTLKILCDVNATCMSRALMMRHVCLVLALHLNMPPSYRGGHVESFVHSTFRGSLATLGVGMKME